ncbi:hypothetical protein KQI63_16530 [bacterium]|nr:hypothetical protein [bacterium]
MGRIRLVLVPLLLFSLFFSLAGDGLIMLCTGTSSGHVAYESSINAFCEQSLIAPSCTDDDLHFDNPANHMDDLHPCSDVVIKLGRFHLDRSQPKPKPLETRLAVIGNPTLSSASVLYTPSASLIQEASHFALSNPTSDLTVVLLS